MSYQNTIIANFAIALSEANGFNECFKRLKHSVQELGFDGVLYMSAPINLPQIQKKQPLSIFQASSAYTAPFLKHYAEANLAKDDYTIKATSAGEMGLIDWWEKEREAVLTKSELNVFVIAREEYNVRNGLSIPTLCTPHEISGASVISYDNDQAYSRLIKDNAIYIETLIKLFHNRVQADMNCKRVFLSPLLDGLSKKEKNLLKFIVKGLPLKTIDLHYDISPGYAKNMITNICQKLGVQNVHELRYFLGVYRLIDIL